MAGPYDLPTDRVTGGGDPADDMNAANAAINDLHTRVDAAVPKSLVDAKGDLLVGTADNTVGRLPAGTDGQTIVYDSGEATGMRAADFPSGGGALNWILPKPGTYIGPHGAYGNGTGDRSHASGFVHFAFFLINADVTIDRIAFNVNTTEAVDAKALLYTVDADGYPSELILDSGGVSCASGGNKVITITPMELPAGFYAATLRTDGGSTVRFRATAQYGLPPAGNSNYNEMTAPPLLILADPGSYASPDAEITSWGTTTAGQGSGNSIPVIGLRREAP